MRHLVASEVRCTPLSTTAPTGRARREGDGPAGTQVGRRTLLRRCPLLRWRRHSPRSGFLIEAHSPTYSDVAVAWAAWVSRQAGLDLLTTSPFDERFQRVHGRPKQGLISAWDRAGQA